MRRSHHAVVYVGNGASTRTREGQIAKLPPEILGDIFLQLRDGDEHLNAWSATFALRAYSWVTVMRVCKYWQLVALNCRKLWNAVFVTDKPHLAEAIARSQGTLISVTCLWNTASAESLATVLQELPRIKKLVLRTPRAWVDGITDHSCASQLQHLVISRAGDIDLFEDNDLPNMFVNGTFPRLLDLEIVGYDVQWSNAVFSPTLRCLRIAASYGRRQPLSETMAALAGLPLLEELDMERMLSSDEAGTALQTFRLRNLRHIRLADNVRHCAQLLDCLIFPASARMSLECYNASDALDGFRHISAAIRTKLSEAHEADNILPLLSMSIEHRYLRYQELGTGHTLLICGWRSDRCPDLPFSHKLLESPSLHLSLFSSRPYTTPQLCRGWPLQGVRNLTVCARGCSGQEASDILTATTTDLLPQLKTLSVMSLDLVEALPEFLKRRVPVTQAADEGAVTRSGLSQTHATLPELALLVLPTLEFATTPFKKATLTSYLVSLRAALRARKRAGVPIEEIILDRCGKVTTKQHKELAKAVSQFKCSQCSRTAMFLDIIRALVS